MRKILISLLLALTAVYAKIEDFRVGTWNLQGSSASTENKWQVSVRQMVTGDNPINNLMRQEAGIVPNSARRKGGMVQHGGTAVEE